MSPASDMFSDRDDGFLQATSPPTTPRVADTRSTGNAGASPLSVLASAADGLSRPPVGRGWTPPVLWSTAESVPTSGQPSAAGSGSSAVRGPSRDPSPSYHTCDEDSGGEEGRLRRHRTEPDRRVHFSDDPAVTDDFPAGGRESTSAARSSRLRMPPSTAGSGSSSEVIREAAKGMSRPLVKLETYNGTTSLETFLAKFENASSYLHWTEADRLFHLRASLQDTAGQVLWDTGALATCDEVIKLLRARFGNEQQAERFRAELRARRRKTNESLQTLYQDVCRLLALAYPGQMNPVVTLVGRDAFIDALNDNKLRQRILDREPKTLEDALNVACRLEAFKMSDVNVMHEERGKKQVRTVTDPEPAYTPDEVVGLKQELSELRAELRNCMKVVNASPKPQYASQLAWSGSMAPQLAADAFPSNCEWRGGLQPVGSLPYNYAPPMVVAPVENFGMSTVAQGLSSGAEQRPSHQNYSASKSVASGNSRGRGRVPHKDECRICYGRGHWARDCPEKKSKGQVSNVKGSALKVGSLQLNGAESYVKAKLGDRSIACIFDSGAVQSVIGRKLIPDATLAPSGRELFAANGTPIKIVGEVTVEFTIEGHPMSVNAVVTEEIEELILGIEWLSANECQWNFGNATASIRGHDIKMHRRPSKASLRRIYVTEDYVIPPRHQGIVPVKATWNGLHAPNADWILESRAMGPRVVTARTLLCKDSEKIGIRVINYSDQPFKFRSDRLVGNAIPATALEPITQYAESASKSVVSITTEPANLCAAGERMTASRRRPAKTGEGGVGAAVPAKTGEGSQAEQRNKSVFSPTGENMPRDRKQYAHVDCLIDSLPSDLKVDERRAAVEFIEGNVDVFSSSEFDLGTTSVVEHRIDTGDSRPIKQQLRRHPITHLEVIDKHVDDMLKHSVIEPAASPWSSNVVLVKKSDGSLRFCVDYRALNTVTYRDNYPLPRIDCCLGALGGSSWFSTLDLRSGYWQASIHPSDRDKTAFVTRKGMWRFKVLSFGLVNAPSLFQRLMDLVLSGLTWTTCLAYLDDVIVFAPSFDEMVERLSAVLDRLRKANLKLKPSKCKLFQRRVTFLGHVVSASGLEPESSKIDAVRNWPRPRCLRDVRSFCGLASYYRSFVSHFSEIARPLHALTRKGQRFNWGWEQEQAFNELKQRLSSAPVLAAPIDEGKFVLDTDASDKAIGAVLQQYQGQDLKVIAYASRCLSQAERAYCVTRRELLACIYGLKRWRQYLLGRPMIIRTDHSALTHLLRAAEPVGQSARYLDLLSEYNFVIQHRSGSAHRNADLLSRRPCERETDVPCKQCSSKTVSGLDQHVSVESECVPSAVDGLVQSRTATYENNSQSNCECVSVLNLSSSVRKNAGERMSCGKGNISDGPKNEMVTLATNNSNAQDLGEWRNSDETIGEGAEEDEEETLLKVRVDSGECVEPVYKVDLGICEYAAQDASSTDVCRAESGESGGHKRFRSTESTDRPNVRDEFHIDAGSGVRVVGSTTRDNRKCSADCKNFAVVNMAEYVMFNPEVATVTDSVADGCIERVTRGKTGEVGRASEISQTGEMRSPRDVNETGEVNRPRTGESAGSDETRPTNATDRTNGTNRPVTGETANAANAFPSTKSAVVIEGLQPGILPSLSYADLRQAQIADNGIKPILEWRESSERAPQWNVVQPYGEETRILWGQFDSLVVENGVLYRKYYNPDGAVKNLQLVLPEKLRETFVTQLHAGFAPGHYALRKNAELVARYFYWPKWKSFLQSLIRRCVPCQRFHRGPPPRQAPLKPLTPNGPGDILQIDLVGKLPTGRSRTGAQYTFLLTCIDSYTRYLTLIPLKDKSAICVAEALVDVFCRHSCYNFILSDCGLEFNNEVLNTLCRLLGVEKLRTSIYHPAGNGRCEKSHTQINKIVAKLVQDRHKDWPLYVRAVEFAYNISRHESTGYSPFFLQFGREAKTAVDVVLPVPADVAPPDVNEFADHLAGKMRHAFQIVNEVTGRQTQRMKRNYDSRVHSQSFEVGDYVYFWIPRSKLGRYRKWCSYYQGPGRVQKRLSAVNYIVQRTPRSKPMILHVDKLKLYTGPEPAAWVSGTAQPAETESANGVVEPLISSEESRPKRVIRRPARLND